MYMQDCACQLIMLLVCVCMARNKANGLRDDLKISCLNKDTGSESAVGRYHTNCLSSKVLKTTVLTCYWDALHGLHITLPIETTLVSNMPLIHVTAA